MHRSLCKNRILTNLLGVCTLHFSAVWHFSQHLGIWAYKVSFVTPTYLQLGWSILQWTFTWRSRCTYLFVIFICDNPHFNFQEFTLYSNVWSEVGTWGARNTVQHSNLMWYERNNSCRPRWYISFSFDACAIRVSTLSDSIIWVVPRDFF